MTCLRPAAAPRLLVPALSAMLAGAARRCRQGGCPGAQRPGWPLLLRVEPVGLPVAHTARGDESAPVVDADPASPARDDHAAGKRGGELAATGAFGGQVLLARAGLIWAPTRSPAGCRGGCGGSSAAATCSPRGRRICRCSTSTAATSRPGCCTPQTPGSVVPSTPSARPARQHARSPGSREGCHRFGRTPGLGASRRHRKSRHRAMDRVAGLGAAGQRTDRPAHR